MLNGVNPFMNQTQGSQSSGKSEESKGAEKKQEKAQGSEGNTRQSVDHGGGKIMRDFADTMIDMAKEKGEKSMDKKGSGFQAMA